MKNEIDFKMLSAAYLHTIGIVMLIGIVFLLLLLSAREMLSDK